MWQLNSEPFSYAGVTGAIRRHNFASSLASGDLQWKEAQCDGVLLIKLMSSPEPFNCLFVFKFQSVPAHLTGSFSEPGRKGLKGVWWRIYHVFTDCKAPRQPTAPHLCCSGLTAFSPW